MASRAARWLVFDTKNITLRFILEGLGMENVGIFYGRLEYSTYKHLVCFIAILHI
jgi:hypothetical protein